MKHSVGASLLLMFMLPIPAAAQYTPPKAQWGLDFSPTWAGAVSFAGRLGDSPWMGGVSGGYAWEFNNHTFDRQFWEVLHLEAFGRYQRSSVIQADIGVSVASSSPTDDTAGRRVFLGLYSSAMLGYRFLFFGPQARVGLLDSEFGAVWSLAVRGVLSIGS